jgi:hypothetical protein
MQLIVLLFLLSAITASAVPRPPYGSQHLASHASSFTMDARNGDLSFEFDDTGKVKRIFGEKYEGGRITLHWVNDKIESVDLALIPIAPDMRKVTEPTFLVFVQNLIDKYATKASGHSDTGWKDFIEKETGPMRSEYLTSELRDLINKSKNFELRMRIKVLPVTTLAKLGLKVASSDPFKVGTEQIETLSREKILSTLAEVPLSECERLLKLMPLR